MPANGRGTFSNRDSRFLEQQREAVDDGWYRDEAAEALAEEVLVDSARSIITSNDSPDVPFARSINPYRGCAHGCSYCYARPSHAYLGLSPGLDFETRIAAKPNAAARLRKELGKPAGPVAELLSRRFELCTQRLGLATPRESWDLRCDRFLPPGGSQLSLDL